MDCFRVKLEAPSMLLPKSVVTHGVYFMQETATMTSLPGTIIFEKLEVDGAAQAVPFGDSVDHRLVSAAPFK